MNELNPTQTWRKLITAEMELRHDCWEEVVACTLSNEELDVEFNAGYKGDTLGKPFTLWTHTRVYYPVTYDGSEWVDSVSRHPCAEGAGHSGG